MGVVVTGAFVGALVGGAVVGVTVVAVGELDVAVTGDFVGADVGRQSRARPHATGQAS